MRGTTVVILFTLLVVVIVAAEAKGGGGGKSGGGGGKSGSSGGKSGSSSGGKSGSSGGKSGSSSGGKSGSSSGGSAGQKTVTKDARFGTKDDPRKGRGYGAKQEGGWYTSKPVYQYARNFGNEAPKQGTKPVAKPVKPKPMPVVKPKPEIKPKPVVEPKPEVKPEIPNGPSIDNNGGGNTVTPPDSGSPSSPGTGNTGTNTPAIHTPGYQSSNQKPNQRPDVFSHGSSTGSSQEKPSTSTDTNLRDHKGTEKATNSPRSKPRLGRKRSAATKVTTVGVCPKPVNKKRTPRQRKPASTPKLTKKGCKRILKDDEEDWTGKETPEYRRRWNVKVKLCKLYFK